jgi:heptosyltransferase-2
LNILIVKIGAIGDVAMCLPLVSRIKQKHPEARITWLCGEIAKPLLQRIPEIDRIISVDENKLFKGNTAEKVREIFRIWNIFSGASYNETLYFYYSDLYKILILPVRKGQIKRFNKNPSVRIRPVPARHHSFEYLSVFEGESTGVTAEISYPAFILTEEDFRLLQELKDQNNLIALSCGGAKNFLRNDDLRRWPVGHYTRLAGLLIEKGYSIVLTGAASDAWVSEHFRDVKHHNFIGKLNLPEFVSLLSLCRMLITHDSGPLHLADIAGIPSFGLFGPTNPGDFRSLHPLSKYHWGGENLSCRPCYDGRSYAPCLSNVCMQQISPEDVFQEIGPLLF